MYCININATYLHLGNTSLYWQARVQVQAQSQIEKGKRNLDSGLSLKSYGATHPITFKHEAQRVKVTQYDPCSAQNKKWTARGRTWMSPTCSRSSPKFINQSPNSLAYPCRLESCPSYLSNWSWKRYWESNMTKQVWIIFKFSARSEWIRQFVGKHNEVKLAGDWNDFGNQFLALEFHFKIITALRISRLQCGNPVLRKYCRCYFFSVPIISI